MNNGLQNCDVLRAIKANADFLKHALKKGKKSMFLMFASNKPYIQDSTLALLNISNFRTNKAGESTVVHFLPILDLIWTVVLLRIHSKLKSMI
jgi:hypothetical protein